MKSNKRLKPLILRSRKFTNNKIFTKQPIKDTRKQVSESRFWHGFDRLVSAATLASIILGGVVFYIQVGELRNAQRDRLVQQQNRADDINYRDNQKLVEALDTLKNGTNGDDGKSSSMQLLLEANMDFSSIDFSCKTAGGTKCKYFDGTAGGLNGVALTQISFRRPYGLDLDEYTDYSGMSLNGSRIKDFGFYKFNTDTWFISDSEINNFRISKSELKSFYLDVSFLRRFGVIDSDIIEFDFEDSTLSFSYFIESNVIDTGFFNVTFDHVRFENSRISGSDFEEAKFKRESHLQFNNVWAWKDNAPDGVPTHLSVKLCVFNEKNDDRLVRPENC